MLAGIFTFLLLRRMGLRRPAALLGATCRAAWLLPAILNRGRVGTKDRGPLDLYSDRLNRSEYSVRLCRNGRRSAGAHVGESGVRG